MELLCHEDGRFQAASGSTTEYMNSAALRASSDPTLTRDRRALQNLLSLEKTSRASPSYFGTIQTDIQPYMRRILAVWMLQVMYDKISKVKDIQVTVSVDFDTFLLSNRM